VTPDERERIDRIEQMVDNVADAARFIFSVISLGIALLVGWELEAKYGFGAISFGAFLAISVGGYSLLHWRFFK
jgi:hypothetical protein